MKTRIIILAAMAAASASCAGDYEPIPETPSKVELTIDIDAPETRAVLSATDTSDRKFNNVQVFVYNASNALECSSGIKTTRSGITLSLVPGTKTVWAVVNAPSAITAPSSLSGFPECRSQLTDNTLSSMVMSGSASINLVTSTNLSVTVKHLACKIVLDKVTRKFTNQNYSEVPLTINRIYMSNVAADCNFGCTGAPENWICKKGDLGSSPVAEALLLDNVTGGDLPENGSYTKTHTFYVYPNPTTADSNSTTWSPRKTRLVLECTYNNKTCYYPVTIPGSSSGASVLERNKVYRISELTLKRPGSMSKDNTEPQVSSNSDFSFSISVADWDTGATYTEQF